MNLITYLTIAYKQNYELEKLTLNIKIGEKTRIEKNGVRNTKQIYSVDTSKTRGFECKWIGHNVLRIFSLWLKLWLNYNYLNLNNCNWKFSVVIVFVIKAKISNFSNPAWKYRGLKRLVNLILSNADFLIL